ncbi:hypothetical protein LTR05_002158 [Lithohypha guttulata]|uniref:Uncharacterized protein n=1 Tax=Lithohypha guttulata TaxID=1690604 RepID=A0AAN7T456_9EURO|nr:hypothetical protein LTR05_002158 [Lithohypha guttulata]
MSDTKVALITGCSSGGLGAALAIALKPIGYRVIATARNTSKLEETRAAGIESLELDVLSPKSISACVEKLTALTGRLDLLVNNAGSSYYMPVMDIDVAKAKEVFDLNVWSLVNVSQAFLPLLLKSPGAKIANNLSIATYLGLPIQATYNASKAAANQITESMRLELAPFDIKVVALLTGSVKSNLFNNLPRNPPLPENSIYRVVPGGLTMMNDPAKLMTEESDMDAQTWAGQVAAELVKVNPPHQIWRGSHATVAKVACHFPVGMFDGQVYQQTKFDEVERALKMGKTS